MVSIELSSGTHRYLLICTIVSFLNRVSLMSQCWYMSLVWPNASTGYCTAGVPVSIHRNGTRSASGRTNFHRRVPYFLYPVDSSMTITS